MITITKIINISIILQLLFSISFFFFFMMKTLKIYLLSEYQVYNIVLTTVTMLYIRSPELQTFKTTFLFWGQDLGEWLGLEFSNCIESSSSRITWEIVKNAHSKDPLRPIWKTLGAEPESLCFKKNFQVILIHTRSLRTSRLGWQRRGSRNLGNVTSVRGYTTISRPSSRCWNG